MISVSQYVLGNTKEKAKPPEQQYLPFQKTLKRGHWCHQQVLGHMLFFLCLASTSLVPSVFASRVGGAPVRVNCHHSLDKALLFYLNPWGSTRSQIKNAEGAAVLSQKVWALTVKGPSLLHISPESKARDKANIYILFSLFSSGFHYFHLCASYTYTVLLSS